LRTSASGAVAVSATTVLMSNPPLGTGADAENEGIADAIEGAIDDVVAAAGGLVAGPQLNASHAVVARAMSKSGRSARTGGRESRSDTTGEARTQRGPSAIPSGYTAAVLRTSVLLLALVANGCLFRPCNWDHQPARCSLAKLEVHPPTSDAVWVEATYRLAGAGGERTINVSVSQVVPGVTREVAVQKISAYFERHHEMPCTWGRLTSGTCAKEESHIDMPGCRDQKSRICYELADEEL
jgi:hypothetical protein